MGGVNAEWETTRHGKLMPSPGYLVHFNESFSLFVFTLFEQHTSSACALQNSSSAKHFEEKLASIHSEKALFRKSPLLLSIIFKSCLRQTISGHMARNETRHLS